MDNNIVITFHSNDALEIVTKKKQKPDVKIVQLPKLMGALLLKLMFIT
jgi:hypothetical protein